MGSRWHTVVRYQDDSVKGFSMRSSGLFTHRSLLLDERFGRRVRVLSESEWVEPESVRIVATADTR